MVLLILSSLSVQIEVLNLHLVNKIAPMHFRRCYVSVCVVDGKIYAMGGECIFIYNTK